jgi:hypothetical protein
MVRTGLMIGLMTGAMSAHMSAQTAAVAEPPDHPILFQDGPGRPAQAAGLSMGVETVEWLPFEFRVDAAGVKGAPYSATAVTETTQVLSDGNRIARKVESAVYRDGEGRTRREQTLAGIAPIDTSARARQTITIHDPVSGEHFILDPEQSRARRLKVFDPSGEAPHAARISREVHVEKGHATSEGPKLTETVSFAAKEGGDVLTFRAGHGVGAAGDAQTEPLGTEVIEGVSAEGVRSTVVIPAGQIGNERPIEIVSERWFSPELKTVIVSRHSDPRAGETVYRLTKIVRAEPDPTLFQVPADYTVEDMHDKIRSLKKVP